MRHGNPESVAVAILAKAPVAGSAKTRLIPALGADGAAQLQARLIRRTVATACEAAIGPVILWVTPDGRHPIFIDIASKYPICLAPQPEGDLGARMLAAFAGNTPALVIGTDCPPLTTAHLRDAARILRSGPAVVIPAEDGGYVLIGLRQPEPGVFADMIWGTDTVMEQTRVRFRGLRLDWHEFPPLWDLDRPEDLARLDERP
jgi:rSAM/selenodomain-associated transferase 1